MSSVIMRRLIVIALLSFFAYTVMPVCDAQRKKDVFIPLDLIHTDAAFKQFKRASRMNQYEILSDFIRQGNERYLLCENMNDLKVLREHVSHIDKYMKSARQSYVSLQMEHKLLWHKIAKSREPYVGEIPVGIDVLSEYSDFGQDLD